MFPSSRFWNTIFKASALWADAFYKSKCPSVCVSVCLCVCVFTFGVPFKRLFPPLPKVGCPIILEFRNPWGKVMERSGLIFEHFCLKIVKNRRAFFFVFFADFALQIMVETTLPDGLETSGQRAYRKFWHISRRFWVFAFCSIFSVFQKNRVFGYSWSTRKPRFPMDWRPLVEGRIDNFGIFLNIFEFLRFGWFFPLKKKLGFGVFLVHAPMASVLLSASVKRCFVSHMRDFFQLYLTHMSTTVCPSAR